MITIKTGDIFDSQAQTLVNTVNCVGIMGKGIALEFKKRFPDMYKDYEQRCKEGKVKLGEPYLFRRLTLPWILNIPTKDHWRSVSRLQDIIDSLQYLEDHCRQWEIASLAVPPLGCGEGQLEWRIVGPSLYRFLQKLDIPVEIYAPFGTPHEELMPAFLKGHSEDVITDTKKSREYRITPAWVALVEILQVIESKPYHQPVGRTTFQKIAYFATESGIPTGLRYKRGSFGPHADDLKRRITALVNNGLIQEERLGRMFAVRVGPTYRDARLVYTKQIESWCDIIAKIVDLFLRMNTQQAEVAATVHFAAMELRRLNKTDPHEVDILKQALTWKQRRRPPLNEKEIALSIRHLNILNWIEAKISPNLSITEEEVLNV